MTPLALVSCMEFCSSSYWQQPSKSCEVDANHHISSLLFGPYLVQESEIGILSFFCMAFTCTCDLELEYRLQVEL